MNLVEDLHHFHFLADINFAQSSPLSTSKIQEQLVSTSAMSFKLSRALVAALGFSFSGALPTDNSALIASLKTDPTAISRYQQLLTNNGELLSDAEIAATTVFDFNLNKGFVPGSQGGSASQASLLDFPILAFSGLQLNVASLGPCGLFLPHVHPRANEFFTVIEGDGVEFGYMLETGLLPTNPMINGTMNKLQGTLFPQGSVHWQVNNSPDCGNITVTAVLSNEDPGTTPILNQIDVSSGTAGRRQANGDDLDGLRPVLPPQILSIVDSCLARCSVN